MRKFRLYPEERHWWSFNDYGAVLDVMERLRPQSVIEFGPGSSTLALIEGGARKIDCCETDPHWAGVYRLRLQDVYPDVVSIHLYHLAEPVSVPELDGMSFDLALIDGPHQTQREAAIEYCIHRCRAVLFPTEQATGNMHLRNVATALAKKHRLDCEFMETGPLSGAFALLH